MADLLYSVTMSLDGFIAGAGGDMSWLTDLLGPDPVADTLMADVGALLVGARTFGGDDPNRGTDAEGAFGGRWHGPQVVLTHHAPDAPVPGVIFAGDITSAVAQAKAGARDRRYVNVLGAETARQCLAIGALDEILTFVVPVMLGDGVRLFDHPGGTNVRLERLSLTQGPIATALWFRVIA